MDVHAITAAVRIHEGGEGGPAPMADRQISDEILEQHCPVG
jgi:hypothetical protein